MPTDLPPAIRSPREGTLSTSPLPDLPTGGTDLRAMLEAVEEANDRRGAQKDWW